jgi:hypothetical protein
MQIIKSKLAQIKMDTEESDLFDTDIILGESNPRGTVEASEVYHYQWQNYIAMTTTKNPSLELVSKICEESALCHFDGTGTELSFSEEDTVMLTEMYENIFPSNFTKNFLQVYFICTLFIKQPACD